MILAVGGDATVQNSLCAIADELGTVLIHAPTGMCAIAEMIGATFSMIIVTEDLVDMSDDDFRGYVRRLDRRVPIIAARRRPKLVFARAA